MREFVRQHLVTSKRMPLKVAPRGFSEQNVKKFERRTKRERKQIAQYYRLRRLSDGLFSTRVIHRMQGVISASEARIRIKHLS